MKADSQSIAVFMGMDGRTAQFQTRMDSGFQFPPDLDGAIKRAQKNLLNLQHAEGYWVGELMVDATLVADMVAYHHWDGKIDLKWERKAIHHMFSKQLPEGGW